MTEKTLETMTTDELCLKYGETRVTLTVAWPDLPDSTTSLDDALARVLSALDQQQKLPRGAHWKGKVEMRCLGPRDVKRDRSREAKRRVASSSLVSRDAT